MVDGRPVEDFPSDIEGELSGKRDRVVVGGWRERELVRLPFRGFV